MARRFTTRTGNEARHDPAGSPPAVQIRRWLLLVHQLPSTPSNLRVRTWRRLQQLGAVPVKGAAYVLPDTTGAREDFEWLKSDIKAAGGDAIVFIAESVDAWSDDALVEEFRRVRGEAYAVLEREIERAIKRARAGRSKRARAAQRVRPPVETLRERFIAIERVDFFGSPGRERVAARLQELDELGHPARPAGGGTAEAGSAAAAEYADRLWVTRPRPGVDRMASAWLIRRFIDPQARFAFVADREAVPGGAVPFDMFGVEFSHHDGHCTFETMSAAFSIHDAAVARIAAIVHDLDLKDGRFAPSEAPAIGAIIEGFQLSVPADDALLAQGMALFESLYCAFGHSARIAQPQGGRRPRAPGHARRPRPAGPPSARGR